MNSPIRAEDLEIVKFNPKTVKLMLYLCCEKNNVHIQRNKDKIFFTKETLNPSYFEAPASHFDFSGDQVQLPQELWKVMTGKVNVVLYQDLIGALYYKDKKSGPNGLIQKFKVDPFRLYLKNHRPLTMEKEYLCLGNGGFKHICTILEKSLKAQDVNIKWDGIAELTFKIVQFKETSWGLKQFSISNNFQRVVNTTFELNINIGTLLRVPDIKFNMSICKYKHSPDPKVFLWYADESGVKFQIFM
jgi:hypothetical protein